MSALNYPFKTCVTVDELKSLFISEITTNETTKEGFTTVLLDIIVSSDEMPDDIRAFALKYDIPIVTIKVIFIFGFPLICSCAKFMK